MLTSGIIKDIMASELSSEAALCITTSIPFSLNLFFSARNLLPCKRKNHLGRWFDRRLSQLGNCLTVVTGFRRAQQPNLSFQCSRTLAHTSRATACLAKQILCELPVTNGCCQWRFACFPGLDSSEQLPDKAQQSG